MQVYFFTRTGRSEKAAVEIASRYGVNANRIDDGRKWSGPWGFFRGGMLASMKKILPSEYVKPVPGEQILLFFPLWASSFPPAVRGFVRDEGRENIICLPTSDGSTLKDREGFAGIYDLVGKEIVLPDNIE